KEESGDARRTPKSFGKTAGTRTARVEKWQVLSRGGRAEGLMGGRLRGLALSPGGFGALVAVLSPQPARPDFGKDVAAPIAKNCLACHNTSEAKGGLDLTHREGLLRGGKGGPAVVPSNPEESRLIERVAEGSMPPKKAGKQLPAEEVAALRAWVRAGA